MQLNALREYIARHGWENAGEYVDEGWSGAKASRPQFDKLMQDAGRRRFAVEVVWKVDRFGRSLLNCKTALLSRAFYISFDRNAVIFISLPIDRHFVISSSKNDAHPLVTASSGEPLVTNHPPENSKQRMCKKLSYFDLE
jgi:DNA invertase Pin-like site-specific DNA recombinase